MDDKTIERLIAEMSGFRQSFVFSPFKVNEPFLDRRLKDICELFLGSCKYGSLRLFTNGSALLPDNCRWVADLSRVVHLWVSLNAIDTAEHQKLMQYKTPMFSRIRHHLDVLHNMRTKGTFGHEVVISRVQQSDVEDKLFMRYVRNRWPLFSPFLIKKDSWLGNVDDANAAEVPTHACGRWWELSICSDGKAALCCMDGKGEFSIGDVHRQSLLDIYNAPRFKERRAVLLNRHTVDVCKTCTY